MRATIAPRLRALPARDRLVRDIGRALLVCGSVFAICAVVGVLTIGSPLFRSPSRSAGDAQLSTGSMLFVAPLGNLCQERTIDNATWRIRGGALVDCSEALAKSASLGGGQWSGSRVDIIREGFRNGR
jgi:hypothetical protein